MATLCIDVGNTNIACGLSEAGSWTHHWRLSTDPSKTSDEYEVLFQNLMAGRGISGTSISGVVLSSVVPELNEAMGLTLRKLTGVSPYFVTADSQIGLEIRIDNPHELGPDLIANACAGYSKYKSSVIVVDFGTALSFTCVESAGEKGIIRGVSIAPGLRSAVNSLSSNTAQLPHVQLSPPPKAIGTNTIHSIQSGIVFGYIGLVESLIQRLKSELPEDTKVIATGGLSAVLAGLTKCFDDVDPWLTLSGLQIILERRKPGIYS